MKNTNLLPMYRMYSVIIIIAAFLVLTFSNAFIVNRFEKERNESISNIMQEMSAQKNYIEEDHCLSDVPGKPPRNLRNLKNPSLMGIVSDCFVQIRLIERIGEPRIFKMDSFIF